MTAGWDLARLWHTIARIAPERPALVHGRHILTWGQFDTAAAAVAEALRGDGAHRGDVAALCLPNRPEYLVLLAGALRCGVAPCGVNYRYRAVELAAQLRHLAPAVVFYDARNADTITAARTALPGIRRWCAVGDDDKAVPGALTMGRCLAVDADPWTVASSPDDVLIKCTGGTTGAPLALRWRVSDILRQLNDHNPWLHHDLRQSPSASARLDLADVRLLVASPLMHGSGLTRALGALCAGGAVITTPHTRFDATSILDAAAQHRADTLAIVGDAYALPIADALDAHPDRWALPDLRVISSSGAAWSPAVKRRLLTHLPTVRLVESLGSTEATGLGFSVATTGTIPPTGRFELGRHAGVFRADGSPATPGETGLIGVSWPHPAGLHPAGVLPADRFIHHASRRYLLSGDQVQLVTNREFVFLGRGVDCINTGGEKVHAPEVVNVLTGHPGVVDACVFGVPHPKLGSAVAAVVHLRPGASLTDVLTAVSGQLAGFKTPTVAVPAPVPRTAAGKVDLAASRALVANHSPSSPTTGSPAPATAVVDVDPAGHWTCLTRLARHEQALLTAALGSLFTAVDIDAQVSAALGYPEWPRPLTLLPSVEPSLASVTWELDTYLAFIPSAMGQALAILDRHGWPPPEAGPAAGDAAWLLLQHADARNDDRRALLPALTRAVDAGYADPRQLALLTDRERSVRGEHQRYATLRLVRDEQPVLLYPTIGPDAAIDVERARIGLPSLAEDARYAYSPLSPYGAARSCPVNAWRPAGLAALRPGAVPAAPPDCPEPVPAAAVGVYLAATLRYRNQTRRVREHLPAPLVSTGRWLDLDPVTRTSCQLDAGLAVNQLAARICLTDIARADLLIAFTKHRRSHGVGVEIGAAVAQGKPVILVGPPRCSFDMLPAVTVVADVDEAVRTAVQLARGR